MAMVAIAIAGLGPKPAVDTFSSYVAQKTASSRKALPGLQAHVQLAKEVGARLGAGAVLLRALSPAAKNCKGLSESCICLTELNRQVYSSSPLHVPDIPYNGRKESVAGFVPGE